MLMIAEDAAEEARRLTGQGTVIEPTLCDADLIASATPIDGSILVDPMGLCHAIGLILDGPANDLCSAARGSRYNSAIRYVGASEREWPSQYRMTALSTFTRSCGGAFLAISSSAS